MEQKGFTVVGALHKEEVSYEGSKKRTIMDFGNGFGKVIPDC